MVYDDKIADYKDDKEACQKDINPKLIRSITIFSFTFFLLAILPTVYYMLFLPYAFTGLNLFTKLRFFSYCISALLIDICLLTLFFITKNYKLHLKLILIVLISIIVLALVNFVAANKLYYTPTGYIAYFIFAHYIAYFIVTMGIIFLVLAIFWIMCIKNTDLSNK